MNAYVADCQIVACHHNLVRYENNRLPIGSRIFLPQDYAADVYHKVRLGAGPDLKKLEFGQKLEKDVLNL